jgi:hypothetical protein
LTKKRTASQGGGLHLYSSYSEGGSRRTAKLKTSPSKGGKTLSQNKINTKGWGHCLSGRAFAR